MQLNAKQTEVKELVKASLRTSLRGGTPNQILLLVHGPSGTGKTVALASIATLFHDMDSTALLFKGSPSETSALKLGGTFLNESTIKASTFEGKKYILIDDCSCLSAAHLQLIDKAVWDPSDVTQDIVPFGGRTVVLFGDFCQHPPVEKHWDTLWWPNFNALHAIRPFMQHTIVFSQDMTSQANDWVELTRRVRSYVTTAADVAYLNKRIMVEIGTRITDGPTMEWPGGIVITHSATKVLYWNLTYASCVSRASNKKLIISRSTNEHVLASEDRITEEHFAVLLERLKVECALVGTLYIFEGMPVTVWRPGGSKVWGHIKDIVLDKREDTSREWKEYRLKYAIKEVTVCIAGEVLNSNPGMDTLLVVRPITVNYTVTHPADEERMLTVERTQVPLKPRFAIMESDAIGEKYPRVIVDTHDGLNAFRSPYMALTRVASNGQLYITCTLRAGEKVFDEVAVEDLKQVIQKLEGDVYTANNDRS
ncbi:hypothetical protein F5879DRAFT_995747 [Lentinula edodes]|nr:hypothetical protein F5879DRAFT_995747 [Lentinula edodes]